MEIQHNISLKPYNTFGIDVEASYFVAVSNIDELKAVLALKNYPEKLILGGGSNMLLTKNQGTLVIHTNLKGIKVIFDNEDFAIIKANAGENWHEFVLSKHWCLWRGTKRYFL